MKLIKKSAIITFSVLLSSLNAFAGGQQIDTNDAINDSSVITLNDGSQNSLVVFNGDSAKLIFDNLEANGSGIINDNKFKGDRPVIKSENVQCVKNGTLTISESKPDFLETMFKEGNYACSIVIDKTGKALKQIGLFPSDDEKFTKNTNFTEDSSDSLTIVKKALEILKLEREKLSKEIEELRNSRDQKEKELMLERIKYIQNLDL